MTKATKKNVEAAALVETGLSFELHKGDGYYYFTWEMEVDGKCVAYETHSVYTMYLANMPLERWVAEAEAFAAYIKAN